MKNETFHPVIFILLLLLIVLYFTGCAGVPTKPAAIEPAAPVGQPQPQVNAAIGENSTPETGCEIDFFADTPDDKPTCLKSTENAPENPEVDFFPQESPEKLAAEGRLFDSRGIPIGVDGVPLECRKLPANELRACWNTYIMFTVDPLRISLGQFCDYDFQCDHGILTRTCQYGVVKGKEWKKACTVKLPEEP